MRGEPPGQGLWHQLWVGTSQDTPGRRSPSCHALESSQEFLSLCKKGARVGPSGCPPCLSQLLRARSGHGPPQLCRGAGLAADPSALEPHLGCFAFQQDLPGLSAFPGAVPWSLEPSRASCLLWCLLVLPWDPPSPPSLPQPLDAPQSTQFLLPGSPLCLWGHRRVTIGVCSLIGHHQGCCLQVLEVSRTPGRGDFDAPTTPKPLGEGAR